MLINFAGAIRVPYLDSHYRVDAFVFKSPKRVSRMCHCSVVKEVSEVLLLPMPRTLGNARLLWGQEG